MLFNLARIALSIAAGWLSSILFVAVNANHILPTPEAHRVAIFVSWAAVSCALIALSIRKGG